MDDDFLHPEHLLHTRVALVQRVFPQDDGEAASFAVGAENSRDKSDQPAVCQHLLCVTVSDLTSYPSAKQCAAVRTQQDEIRLPPQRKTFSLDLLRQNTVATHGWDSTGATVPPTIFKSFRLVRWPHVNSAAAGLNQHNVGHSRGKEHVKVTCGVQYNGGVYLALDEWVQAKAGLELQDERVKL